MLYESTYNNLKSLFKRYEEIFKMEGVEPDLRPDRKYNITYSSISDNAKFQFFILEHKDRWEVAFNCNAPFINGSSRYRKAVFYLNARATQWMLSFKTNCFTLSNFDLTLQERAALLGLTRDFLFIENRYYNKLEQEKNNV